MSIEIMYFVHGTTYDNAESKCSGWKQVELSELGKQQAINLGNNTNYSFDIIFTSDLVRAIDSANLAWPETVKKTDERLRECNYGDYDGKDKNLVLYEDHISNPFPNGEDEPNNLSIYLVASLSNKIPAKGSLIGIIIYRINNK